MTGYDIWLRSDFRMESANGDFVKRWATLPYLITRPKLVSTSGPAWRAGDPYWAGYRFLFEIGNDADALLFQGRVMIVLLGVATGLLVFACARELFGAAGGVVALGVFVFSPNMLAFGGIVSTEMTLCFALLGSTWCVWRLLHRITWGRIAGSLAVFCVLVLSKPTAVLILPTVALLIAVKLAFGRPLEIALGASRVVTQRWAQVKYFLVLIAVHAAIGWTAIWAHYDFDYAASPNPEDPTIASLVRPQKDPINPLLQETLEIARRRHLFPEGFLYGVEWLLGHDDERHAFLAGEWTYGGWRRFFLRAALAKTRPAFAALLALGLAWWMWRWRVERRGRPPGDAAPGPIVPSFYWALPYFAFAAVYLPMAIVENLNIGHRHILPLYPPAYVLTGSVVLLWQAGRVWVRTIIGALCVYFVVETVSVAPNYLAYFSPLTGGPSKGYTQLVDSSLDWGMNLPLLKRWLDKNNPGDREEFYLAYFGTDSPGYRHIKSHRLPGFFDWGRTGRFPLNPGLYAISATLLQTVYTRTFGPWNKIYERDYREVLNNLAIFEGTANDPAARAELLRQHPAAEWEKAYEAFEHLRFGRLCAWLRHNRPPDHNIGHAILIWRLSAADLHAALAGPPVELAEEPVLPP
jgi:4-amino-4-deoxy-L-arabinose transferase-like glycosyltransferase